MVAQRQIVFWKCPHTCGHTKSRGTKASSTDYIFSKNVGSGFKDHTKAAHVHRNCRQGCPAFNQGVNYRGNYPAMENIRTFIAALEHRYQNSRYGELPMLRRIVRGEVRRYSKARYRRSLPEVVYDAAVQLPPLVPDTESDQESGSDDDGDDDGQDHDGDYNDNDIPGAGDILHGQGEEEDGEPAIEERDIDDEDEEEVAERGPEDDDDEESEDQIASVTTQIGGVSVDRGPSMVNQVTEPMPKNQNQGREREVGQAYSAEDNTTNIAVPYSGSPASSSSAPSHLLANTTVATPHTDYQSSSSSQLAKRKRTPDDTVPPAPRESAQPKKCAKTSEGYTKHSVFWAADGNIFVQIADTRFKVYRGHLAKHSGWFRAVFDASGAVEEPARETTLGLQPDEIIVLDELGVAVKDFELLLGALDEAIDYCYSPPPFPTVAAILRAAHALDFSKYIAWATQYLTDMWPTSLSSVSASLIPFAKTSVSLAHQCGLSSILKRALYELVRQDGFGQDDDVTLSPSDYQALLRAREHLASAWVKTATCLAPQLAQCLSDSPHCATRDPNSVNSAHIELIHASGIFEAHLYDLICGLQVLMEDPRLSERFCEVCVSVWKDVWMKEREKVWANLDVWLGLEAANG